MEHHSQSEKLTPYEKEKAKVHDLETKLKQLDLIINSIQHASYETGREIRSSLRQLEDETEGIGQLLDEVKRSPETVTGEDFSVDINELEGLYNERFAEQEETREFLNQGDHLMFPTAETSEVYSKGHNREYESESFEEALKRSVFRGLREQPPKHLETLVSRLETIGITWDELKGAIEAYGLPHRGDDNWAMHDVLGNFRRRLVREVNEARLAVPSEVREMHEEVRVLAETVANRKDKPLQDVIALRHGGGEVNAEQAFRIIKESGWLPKELAVYPDEMKAVYFNTILDGALNTTEDFGLKVAQVESIDRLRTDYTEKEKMYEEYVKYSNSLRQELEELKKLENNDITLTFVPYDIKHGEFLFHREYSVYDGKANWPVLDPNMIENPFIFKKWSSLARQVEEKLAAEYGYDEGQYQIISPSKVRGMIDEELKTWVQSEEFQMVSEAVWSLKRELEEKEEKIQKTVARPK